LSLRLGLGAEEQAQLGNALKLTGEQIEARQIEKGGSNVGEDELLLVGLVQRLEIPP
jgi:hypothetical protein